LRKARQNRGGGTRNDGDDDETNDDGEDAKTNWVIEDVCAILDLVHGLGSSDDRRRHRHHGDLDHYYYDDDSHGVLLYLRNDDGLYYHDSDASDCDSGHGQHHDRHRRHGMVAVMPIVLDLAEEDPVFPWKKAAALSPELHGRTHPPLWPWCDYFLSTETTCLKLIIQYTHGGEKDRLLEEHSLFVSSLYSMLLSSSLFAVCL